MPVPLNNLRRDRNRRKAELFADILFHKRIHKRKRAHGARDFAAGDGLARALQARAVAPHLRIPQGQFQAEGDRLGVNAVRPADHQGLFMLQGPSFQNRQQVIQIFQKKVGRLFELHRQRRVQNIRGGKPHMNKTAVFADDLGQRRNKRDHVMPGDRFDFIDAGCVDHRFGFDVVHRRGRREAELHHRLAGRHFHIQPLGVLVFLAPDRRHFFS